MSAPSLENVAPAAVAIAATSAPRTKILRSSGELAFDEGSSTTTGPGFAAAGTVASISVGPRTVNVASWPAIVTRVAPVRLRPMIDSVAPRAARNGSSTWITGSPASMVRLGHVALPAGWWTITGPLAAPIGTSARIAPGRTDTGITGAAPLNSTVTRPAAPPASKPLPEIKTRCPIPAGSGVIRRIAGAPATSIGKLVAPPGPITSSVAGPGGSAADV